MVSELCGGGTGAYFSQNEARVSAWSGSLALARSVGFRGVSIWFWPWRGGVRIDAYRADPPRAFLRVLRWDPTGRDWLADRATVSGRACRVRPSMPVANRPRTASGPLKGRRTVLDRLGRALLEVEAFFSWL